MSSHNCRTQEKRSFNKVITFHSYHFLFSSLLKRMAKRDSDFAFGYSYTGLGFGDDGSNEDSNDSLLQRGRKKRRSRWAEKDPEDSVVSGLPTVVPPGLTKEQEEQYLLQLQIEEISRRLKTGDLGIPSKPEDRSPSPEPIYNNEGKRLNTREYRTRRKIEDQRHELIQKQLQINPSYKPPADYKPPVVKVTDKVPIPQEEHPDINFVGLLIGPRGNTLKNLEKETGAKIIIRGKGSVKEGKIGRKDGQPMPGEDEPLHAYITANNPEFVHKAVEKIKEIIQQGIEVPEQQNDLRRQQLRELALLNGTLRENDSLAKLKQLQQAQTIITNTIMCTRCGGAGHIAADCKGPRPGDSLRSMMAGGPSSFPAPGQHFADKAKMDSEYSALMAELGEGTGPVNKPFSHGNIRPLMSNSSSSFGMTTNHSTSAVSRTQLQLPPPQNRFPAMSSAPAPLMGQNVVRPLMSGHITAPWQQQGANTTSSPNSMAGPPRPSNFSSSAPNSGWNSSGFGNMGMRQQTAPWQQRIPAPIPPPTGNNPAPWQQTSNYNQSNPMAPPPPPPPGFNMTSTPGVSQAPRSSLPGGIPLGVPPPPPPQ